MQIKSYNFKLRVMNIDNEKWDDEIEIKAVNFAQAMKEFWNNLDKDQLLEELASVVIINLSELRKI